MRQKQILTKTEGGVVVSSGTQLQEESIGGVYGQMPEHVELIFSIEPEDDFTVTITPLDGSGETVVSGSELENFFLLPLMDYDARYTVHANFEPTEDLRFEMVYRFEVCGESDMPSEQGS